MDLLLTAHPQIMVLGGLYFVGFFHCSKQLTKILNQTLVLVINLDLKRGIIEAIPKQENWMQGADGMRILHTADWHLGKIVNEFSLLDDQVAMLDQLIDIIKEEKIDALLMAGDLYDRGVPPKQAVLAFNDFLNRMMAEVNIPILMIAGNHDSNERLEFGTGLFKASDVYIEGTFKPKTRMVDLGGVHVYLMPFADHIWVRQELDMEDQIKNLEEAIQVQVDRIVQGPDFDPHVFNILTMHGYVVNQSRDSIEESDSERPLSIGTTEYVDASIFDDFDYVALGHLHGPQKVKRESIRYSGSLLKYSKSEVNHHKQVVILDIDQDRDPVLKLETRDLIPDRDMRVLRGSFDDLAQGQSDDYIFFELEDPAHIMDAMSRLRKKYPNAMGIDYVNLKGRQVGPARGQDAKDMRHLAIDDLFQQFFQHYRGQDLTDQQLEIVQEVANQAIQEGDE